MRGPVSFGVGEALIKVGDAGLECPAGGFHVDPWRPVPLAVVTHAHSDHATPGSTRYLCAASGAGVLRRRLGASAVIEAIPEGQSLRLGGVDVSLHPAGHVRGSAQVRVASASEVWVVSGDYKREPDPTCAPFEVVPCDVFITEATFALPIYRWRPTAEVVAEIVEWWRQAAASGRVAVVFCYALGKAQRLLAELSLASGTPRDWAWVHGSVEPLVAAYRDEGVEMLRTRLVGDGTEPRVGDAQAPAPARRRRGALGEEDLAGSLVIAPPSAAGTPWMRRFGPPSMVETAFVSGWMRVRGVRRRRGYDRGFVLSDHADWPGLMRTIRQCGARRVLATHGSSEVLARALREQGLESEPIRTRYVGEEGGAD